MRPAAADITERELREAFNRSGLWRRGWTYQRAIACATVLRGLMNTADAMRRRTERNTGKPAPLQQALI